MVEEQVLHLLRAAEVDLRLPGEVGLHEAVEHPDIAGLNDLSQHRGHVVVGELLAQVLSHRVQLALLRRELHIVGVDQDRRRLLDGRRGHLGEDRAHRAGPAPLQQEGAEGIPRLVVRGVVLLLHPLQGLQRDPEALHEGKGGQVLGQRLHVQEHLPRVLQLHDELVVRVQGCSGDRVVATVVEDAPGGKLAHLVLAVLEINHDGGFLLDDRDLTGFRIRHLFGDGGCDLLPVGLLHRPARHLAHRPAARGHLLVGLLVVPEVMLAAELEALGQVLIHVGGANLRVQRVGDEPVPAIVHPLLAPRAVQHAELEVAVLDDDVLRLRDQLHRLAALVDRDVFGLCVVHAHVDRVLGVKTEGHRHTGQLMSQNVDFVATRFLAYRVQAFDPLVALLGGGRLNVEPDERRVFEAGGRQAFVDCVVVGSRHQRLGAIELLQFVHPLGVVQLVPLRHHPNLPVKRAAEAVDRVQHEAGHAPRGSDHVLGVQHLLQHGQVRHGLLELVQLAVDDHALHLVKAFKPEHRHQLDEGDVPEPFGAGDLVGVVPDKGFVQGDVLVRERAVRVLVQFAAAPDVRVVIDQPAQVAVHGGHDIALGAQVPAEVGDHVVALDPVLADHVSAQLQQHVSHGVAGLVQLR